MDISGLVEISVGMIFLGPRFRTTRILAGSMWKYKLHWHHKIYDCCNIKIRSRVTKFYSSCHFSTKYESLCNGVPHLPKWKIYETVGDKDFECKIYVSVFVYIFEAFDISRCHLLMTTPYPAVKLSRQSLLHAWKEFCVDKCCHF